MAVPTKLDIKKKQERLDVLLKSLNADGSMPEKELCKQLRSSIRQVWMYHPVKMSYLLSKKYADMNPNTRTKWLIDCVYCEKPFKQDDIQVDHIKGEHSLKTLKDLEGFARSILEVSHSDLQGLCKPCHLAKTYAEGHSISMEEAFLERAVIAKLGQTASEQKTELTKHGFKPKDMSNEVKRRVCYRKMLT